jgi:peptidoglycan/LPS O-acetylase OafA/YrhL
VIGVSWAASAEMGSYLLVPLMMAIAGRRNPFLCGIVGVIALLAVYGISVSGHGANGSLDVTSGNSFLPLVRAIAGFTLGIAIYRFADAVDRLSAAAQDGLVAVIVLAIVAASILSKSDLPLYLLFIPLVALLSRDGKLAQLLFGNKPVYYFGLISYSIYLIHPLFVSFAVRGWRMFGQTMEVYVAATAVCLGVIWLLSDLSYRFIEMPGRKLVVGLLVPPRPSDRTGGSRSVGANTSRHDSNIKI